ncbi:MAG TPA: magnesium transporter CorA family protein [Gemmatimonadaceae bacterium]
MSAAPVPTPPAAPPASSAPSSSHGETPAPGGGAAARPGPGNGFPCSYYVDEKGALRRNLSPREMLDVLAAGTGTLWVDVDTNDRHQCAVLDKVFKFHPLSVEDALNPLSRVKLEEYPGYLFMIVRGVRFCDETDDPYDIETYNLDFFLGKRFLVTSHAEEARAVEEMKQRIERNPDVLARGAERMMHAIADLSVDAYFPIVDQLDQFIDGLEERVFAHFDQSALRDIFSVKRLVLSLRRHLTPQREVLATVTNRPTPFLTPETQVYFRDVYDHVLRINDSLDTYRELLSSTLDSYLSQVSNRLGMVTKGLSLVATLSIPFVVVSGMWGMNVKDIPIADHPHAFTIMMLIQLVMGIALVALLKWRNWL